MSRQKAIWLRLGICSLLTIAFIVWAMFLVVALLMGDCFTPGCKAGPEAQLRTYELVSFIVYLGAMVFVIFGIRGDD